MGPCPLLRPSPRVELPALKPAALWPQCPAAEQGRVRREGLPACLRAVSVVVWTRTRHHQWGECVSPAAGSALGRYTEEPGQSRAVRPHAKGAEDPVPGGGPVCMSRVPFGTPPPGNSLLGRLRQAHWAAGGAVLALGHDGVSSGGGPPAWVQSLESSPWPDSCCPPSCCPASWRDNHFAQTIKKIILPS